MSPSAATAPTASRSLQVPQSLQGRPMLPDEAEAALEAALLAGAEGANARSGAVQVFLAMSAGLILERMQAAGLSVVRAQDVAHG